MQRLLFAQTYMRNWWSFDGNHARILAATRMDMKLRQLRRRLKDRP